ncbi:MAG: hypothetical protein ACLTTF_10530, partial [Oscillospiraceae bacterium]
MQFQKPLCSTCKNRDHTKKSDGHHPPLHVKIRYGKHYPLPRRLSKLAGGSLQLSDSGKAHAPPCPAEKAVGRQGRHGPLSPLFQSLQGQRDPTDVSKKVQKEREVTGSDFSKML